MSVKLEKSLAVRVKSATEYVESVRSGGVLPTQRKTVSPPTRMKLAQTPSGGIPAMSGVAPGSAECDVLIIAQESGTGYVAGDLIRTADTFTALNWSEGIVSADGKRIVMVDGHHDGAFVVGFDCNATGAAADIKDQ